MLKRLWPSSLLGQVLLSIALSLMLAQAVSAVLIYRAQHERRESALLHSAAFRMIIAMRQDARLAARNGEDREESGREREREGRGFQIERTQDAPLKPGEARWPKDEKELRAILEGQDMQVDEVLVVRRPIAEDPRSLVRLERRKQRQDITPEEVLVAGARVKGSEQWIVARVFITATEQVILGSLLVQTLFIYLVVLGAMILIMRRITRPLAKLTRRVELFAETRSAQDQIEPQGPNDVRRLIEAHNGMEGRILALLDEKDVMLGAIGHDLKTPLAALRVRIESVEDETERRRMAGSIEDITRTLDDILSLARVGRPSDMAEQTELYSLVSSVVEEYEDMGEPVTLGDASRHVMSLRPTWLRRALRNLIGNALRYGKSAHVSLERDGGTAVIRILDEGPGIPDGQIARMLEPFTRGDPSRNTETGGTGLGLTLARAIAEQHGGSLRLANRRAPDGRVLGLEATLRLPG
ncbi:HAMP domain-containing sensor histidine kinase [Novosphingobium sp. TH158]|uniref:sensor histidine kinase n=1 Tax=Novosphingobium sp. TH158 TaxID=2067455 RepID=UPI000C7C6498|nr:ATP-binding protein [Novosphingobium sp. TH158]PLK27336.1 two-component sensor histidine kinase [Novosphingobium sp. TH158]